MTSSPFPRVPDDQPDAWGGEDVRFTPSYEARAQALWDILTDLDLSPQLMWAGSEDGEALVATRGTEIVWLVHLEDPREQERLDRMLAHDDRRDRVARAVDSREK